MSPPHATKPETAPFVRPDVAAMLAMLAQMNQAPMETLTAPEARAAYRMMTPFADAEPTPLAIVRDLTCPGPAGDIGLRYYDAREQREPGPVVMFYHGGGFVIGDLDTHHPLCTMIAAELDLPVVAVDYRLAPEHPFPAAPDDCEAATRWVAQSPSELGLDVTGLVTCGDSAGGNLALVTALSLRRNAAAVPVVAQLPLYPVVDQDHEKYESFGLFGEGYLLTAAGMTWFGDAYRAPAHDVRADPLFDDLTGLPPTLLVTAGLDPLRDQGRAMAARLVEAGVDTVYMNRDGTVHGFACLRKGVPSSQQDMEAVLTRMKALLDSLP